MLTDRLNRLVDQGILERVPCSERRAHYEFLSEKPLRILRRKSDRKPVVVAYVPRGAPVLRQADVEWAPGPGA